LNLVTVTGRSGGNQESNSPAEGRISTSETANVALPRGGPICGEYMNTRRRVEALLAACHLLQTSDAGVGRIFVKERTACSGLRSPKVEVAILHVRRHPF
jgi:hypothetical protein